MRKYLTLVTVLLCTISVKAQFTNSSKSSDFPKGWNDIYVQYNLVKNGAYDDLDKDVKNNVSGFVNGVSIGYTRAIGVSSSVPLYLLVGGAFEYNFKSVDYTEKSRYEEIKEDYSGNVFSFKVPVSITYHFDISDNFALEPFAGVNARYYISAKLIADKEYYYDGRSYSKSKDWDAFSSDDTDNNTANHFIIGAQLGLTAVFSNKFTATINDPLAQQFMPEYNNKLVASGSYENENYFSAKNHLGIVQQTEKYLIHNELIGADIMNQKIVRKMVSYTEK